MTTTDATDSPPDPASELLERTRSAVLDVLIAVGGLIALSGWTLRSRDRGATDWPRDAAGLAAYVLLIGLIFASVATRRVLGSRSRLREPTTRAWRFRRAHVAGALIAALAAPLGFAFAFAVRPTLEAVAPFWVASLALGFLSLPRRHELDGLESPRPWPEAPPHESSEPGP